MNPFPEQEVISLLRSLVLHSLGGPGSTISSGGRATILSFFAFWRAVLCPHPRLGAATPLMLPVPGLLMHAGCWDQMHGASARAGGYEQGGRNVRQSFGFAC